MGGISAAYRRTLEVIDRATSTATLNMKEAPEAPRVRGQELASGPAPGTPHALQRMEPYGAGPWTRTGAAPRTRCNWRTGSLTPASGSLNGLRAQGMTIEAELTRTLEQQAGRRLRILSNESSQRRRMLDAEARASNRAGGGGFAAGVGSAIRQGGAAAYGVATRLHSEVQMPGARARRRCKRRLIRFASYGISEHSGAVAASHVVCARLRHERARAQAGLTSAQDTFAILGEADEWGRKIRARGPLGCRVCWSLRGTAAIWNDAAERFAIDRYVGATRDAARSSFRKRSETLPRCLF